MIILPNLPSCSTFPRKPGDALRLEKTKAWLDDLVEQPWSWCSKLPGGNLWEMNNRRASPCFPFNEKIWKLYQRKAACSLWHILPAPCFFESSDQFDWPCGCPDNNRSGTPFWCTQQLNTTAAFNKILYTHYGDKSVDPSKAYLLYSQDGVGNFFHVPKRQIYIPRPVKKKKKRSNLTDRKYRRNGYTRRPKLQKPDPDTDTDDNDDPDDFEVPPTSDDSDE